eukprot:scaffold996_cov271-Chaetoceros_neogracile.AAC.14
MKNDKDKERSNVHSTQGTVSFGTFAASTMAKVLFCSMEKYQPLLLSHRLISPEKNLPTSSFGLFKQSLKNWIQTPNVRH